MLWRDVRIALGLLLRLSAHLYILVALGLRLVLPIFGPQAMALQVDHKHIILGGSPAAQAKALATHRHGPPTYADRLSLTSTPDPTVAHVVSISGHAGLGPTVVETAALSLFASTLPLPPMSTMSGERLPDTATLGEGVYLPIPLPPPRSLSFA